MHASKTAAEPPAQETAPVELVQFPPAWGRNISPFTLKVEAWLRLARVPYTVATSVRPGQGPKGKLPFLRDGEHVVADSSDIIAHLKDTRGIDPDAWLGLRQRAESHALQRMFEEHFYFVLAYGRWLDEDGFAAVREELFTSLPPLVREIAPFVVRRYMRRLLHFQGIGRHGRDEAYARGLADLEAAAFLLGDKPYFMGDQPATIDAIAYGFLASLYLVPVETALKHKAGSFQNLKAWTERMDRGLFGRG